MIIVTIPAWNEEKTITPVIKDIKRVMDEKGYDYKIMVVDDGSDDKTSEVSKKAGAEVIRKEHSGLLETFKKEMQECVKRKAEIIVHTDADGQYLAEDIPRLIEKLKQGNDLVLGSRFQKLPKSLSFSKKYGNIIFTKALSLLVGTKITDSTTGFRAFNLKVASNIKYISNFTYTHEQIIKAAKLGLNIAEIGITPKKTRESRLFKNPIEYAIKAWSNIALIYFKMNPLKFILDITFLILIILALIFLIVRATL
jgi:glycosyltransferase involved in cell wall biosynthesis